MDTKKDLWNSFKSLGSILFVVAPMGLGIGCFIALYDFIIQRLLWASFVQFLTPVQLSLLPLVGMVLTGLIVKIFQIKFLSMADEVIFAYHSPEVGIPSVFSKLMASIVTMGFGMSAGMEGASKWLGAILASWVHKISKRYPQRVLLLAGAAAGMAAIFRAPLTGAVLAVESPYQHDLAHDALIPSLVASSMSYLTFTALRSSSSDFPSLVMHHQLCLKDLVCCIPFGILVGGAAHVFLGSMVWTQKKMRAYPQAKYGIGGVLLVLLAWGSLFLVGEPVTLQGGLPVLKQLFHGQWALSICIFIVLVKGMATVFTFGCGGVGGLFMPSATIGAALGACCEHGFQTQSGLFPLLGIAAFTGATYHSLLFSAVFIAELTGCPMLMVPSLLVSSIAFMVSAGISNSQFQKKQRSTD